MRPHQLLVSPLAKGAFYEAYLDVAQAELQAHFPRRTVISERRGHLDLLTIELEPEDLLAAARLSFVQAIFSEDAQGGLHPLDADAKFLFPESLVHGAKYRGKTHELVTQLALNLALLHFRGKNDARSLLDPMAGRGTTLFWGLRYGLDVRGVEIEPSARDAVHAHIKKQAKLHRISHTAERGARGGKGKKQQGAFGHYVFGARSLRFVSGDAAETNQLLSQQRFDLLVSDLPYSVDFKAKQGALLELLTEALPTPIRQLRPGGAMVLVFNDYQPSRRQLTALAEGLGLEVQPFTARHRMSESIVRDLLVAVAPA